MEVLFCEKKRLRTKRKLGVVMRGGQERFSSHAYNFEHIFLMSWHVDIRRGQMCVSINLTT